MNGVLARRHFIEPLHYVDAETGSIVETVQMRIFQICVRSDAWETVRWYEFAGEKELNPGFGKPPQHDRAFPNGQERY